MIRYFTLLFGLFFQNHLFAVDELHHENIMHSQKMVVSSTLYGFDEDMTKNIRAHECLDPNQAQLLIEFDQLNIQSASYKSKEEELEEQIRALQPKILPHLNQRTFNGRPYSHNEQNIPRLHLCLNASLIAKGVAQAPAVIAGLPEYQHYCHLVRELDLLKRSSQTCRTIR